MEAEALFSGKLRFRGFEKRLPYMNHRGVFGRVASVEAQVLKALGLGRAAQAKGYSHQGRQDDAGTFFQHAKLL